MLRNNLNDASQPVIQTPKDRIGGFIFPGAKRRGPVDWTVRVARDTAIG